jgi:uncharacterized protein (UPF0335 family)
MSTEVLEQKIHELTRRVERLEAKQRPAAKQTWREIIGTSKGDELDREAARLGEEWRRSEDLR